MAKLDVFTIYVYKSVIYSTVQYTSVKKPSNNSILARCTHLKLSCCKHLKVDCCTNKTNLYVCFCCAARVQDPLATTLQKFLFPSSL